MNVGVTLYIGLLSTCPWTLSNLCRGSPISTTANDNEIKIMRMKMKIN